MNDIRTSGFVSQRSAPQHQAERGLISADSAPLSKHDVRGDDRSAAQRMGAPGDRPALRHVLWWVSFVLGWGVAVSLLAVAALRIFYHDGAFVLIWLNAFTRYVYLPAYACAAWAVWQRRWVLALASGAVVCFHIAWLAPDFLRDRRFDTSAGTIDAAATAEPSPVLRIFFANVAADNREHDAMLKEIASADPDVIALVEYGRSWHLAFKSSPVLTPYKFGSGHLQSHIGSVNVFSKLPLKTEIQNWVGGRATHTIEVALGARTLRVIGLHAPRPMNLPRYNYAGYWQEMLPLLSARQGPLVIVGDFNVTQHSRIYNKLTAEHLRSAHYDRGRGYAPTWPNGQYWLPPIRIDQVFLSPEVECVQIVEGIGLGTDHKPLIVDVRVRSG